MLCEVIVSFESPCCQARLAGSSAGGCRQRDSSRSLHSEVSEIVFDEPANSLALGVALTELRLLLDVLDDEVLVERVRNSGLSRGRQREFLRKLQLS